MIPVVIAYNRNADVVPPTTIEQWGESNAGAVSCLNIRGAYWKLSYLAQDGLRAVCFYDTPNVEAVREGLREVRLVFDAVWKTDMKQKVDDGADAPDINPVIIEIDREAAPLSDEWNTLKESLYSHFQAASIQCLWEFTSPTNQGEVWAVNAADQKSMAIAAINALKNKEPPTHSRQ